MKRLAVVVLLAIVPAAAHGEVRNATATGFEIENKAVISANPAATFAALGRIGSWWNSSHTYSGKAANLRLGLRAGDCFCESWDGGTVEHGRVIHARPGELLRLSAALGPLQAEAVTGTLTFTLKPAPGGTEVTQRYTVGGYVSGGADKFAKPVDEVLAQQLAGLAKSLAR